MRAKLYSTLIKRCASASVAARQEMTSHLNQEKITRMPNGLAVYSVDVGGPVAQLMIAFRAGSRFEQPDETGLTHHMRNAVGIDSKNLFGAQMLWQCGNAGINLVSHLTRDIFAVQTSVIREHASYALNLVSELGQPAFKPWDLEDVVDTLKADLAYLRPYDILMDKLHYAAYRTEPLGNHLYATAEEIGKYDFRRLSNFAESRLVSGQAALIGVNIGHEDMLTYIDLQMKIHNAAGKPAASSKYIGGEMRCPRASEFAHVAIAGEGASLKNPKELAAQAVLLVALSRDSSLKYAPSDSGCVSQAVYKASSGHPFGLSTFNETYADSGLIGIYMFTDADKIGPLAHAAMDALKSFKIDENALQKAKNIARVNFMVRSESSSNLAMDRATQILGAGSTTSSTEFDELISNVSLDALKKAASRMMSKLTLAAYGDIYQVPYLDRI